MADKDKQIERLKAKLEDKNKELKSLRRKLATSKDKNGRLRKDLEELKKKQKLSPVPPVVDVEDLLEEVTRKLGITSLEDLL